MSTHGTVMLMYHCVGRAQRLRSAEDLREICGPSQVHRAVSADALCGSLDCGAALPVGAFVLTFDDRFRGIRNHSVTELECRGWPSIIFLVSDFIGGVDEWTRAENPDRRATFSMQPRLNRRGMDPLCIPRAECSAPIRAAKP